MANEAPTRRTASFVILILAALGALIVLGWAFRTALFAFGLLVKFISGFFGLIIIGLIIYFLAKKLSQIQ